MLIATRRHKSSRLKRLVRLSHKATSPRSRERSIGRVRMELKEPVRVSIRTMKTISRRSIRSTSGTKSRSRQSWPSRLKRPSVRLTSRMTPPSRVFLSSQRLISRTPRTPSTRRSPTRKLGLVAISSGQTQPKARGQPPRGRHSSSSRVR